MNLIDILNNTSGGVVIGIIVTKTFDIFNKKLEYKQEAKKIRYSKKLEIGEQAVKYLQTSNDQLFVIREIIEQLLENEKVNQKLFEQLWDLSHKKVGELGQMTMEMMNSAYFYYDIITPAEEYTLLVKELYNSLSELINMTETSDFSNSPKILMNYKKSIQKIIDSQDSTINMIINQSKK